MIRIRYGGLVTSARQTSYASFKTLAKIFGVSISQARRACHTHFEQERQKLLPLIQQMQLAKEKSERKRRGFRFLKPHEIEWMTCRQTLRAQTGLSLKDRSDHFQKEFPTAHMNPTLLR